MEIILWQWDYGVGWTWQTHCQLILDYELVSLFVSCPLKGARWGRWDTQCTINWFPGNYCLVNSFVGHYWSISMGAVRVGFGVICGCFCCFVIEEMCKNCLLYCSNFNLMTNVIRYLSYASIERFTALTLLYLRFILEHVFGYTFEWIFMLILPLKLFISLIMSVTSRQH